MFGPVRGPWLGESWRGVRPIVLGQGEHLWRDLDLNALGYECYQSVAGERATHVYLRKRS